MTREVTLSNGLIMLVDDADYESVSQHRWHVTGRGAHLYARRSITVDGKKINISISRWLLEARADQIVDHINGDTLDNRRSNLRICTRIENLRNRRRRGDAYKSPYKGVHPHRNRKSWSVSVTKDGKAHYGGCYSTAEEAAKAYDRLAAKLHGEFASLNFPQGA